MGVTIPAKVPIAGVGITVTDYAGATDTIIAAAQAGQPLSVSALAVHGVMEGHLDPEHRYRLNHLDLVLPDGQPVRWAMNLLHRTGLRDRVYGPTLTRHLLERAAADHVPVFFFGSTPEVLAALERNLRERYPNLVLAGTEPSSFRQLSAEENMALVSRIRTSGARLVFVGLGCPRQEVFAFENRDALGSVVIAVGAAFDYHAGLLREPPDWVQRSGLQWLYRLVQQPRRLWRRYVLLNPAFLGVVAAERVGLWRPNVSRDAAPSRTSSFG